MVGRGIDVYPVRLPKFARAIATVNGGNGNGNGNGSSKLQATITLQCSLGEVSLIVVAFCLSLTATWQEHSLSLAHVTPQIEDRSSIRLSGESRTPE